MLERLKGWVLKGWMKVCWNYWFENFRNSDFEFKSKRSLKLTRRLKIKRKLNFGWNVRLESLKLMHEGNFERQLKILWFGEIG